MSGRGGLQLQMNPSLASAMALHGSVHCNCSDPDAGSGTSRNTSQPSGAFGGGHKKSTGIHALAMHPSLPCVAFVAEYEDTTTSSLAAASHATKKNKSAAPTIPQTTAKRQRIVVQQYDRKKASASPGSMPLALGLGAGGAVLASLPMEHLPPVINRFRQPKSKSSKITNQPLTLTSLGPLRSITFLDREALFWQTRRQYGYLTNMQAGGMAMTGGETENPGGLCLGLQFANALVLLRFGERFQNPHPGDASSAQIGGDAFSILCCLEGQRSSGGPGSSSGGSGKEPKVQYTPTSAAIPVTNSVVVYGCSDGAMRFHNLVPSMIFSPGAGSPPLQLQTSLGPVGRSTKQTRQSTIKSVRGPNGRNDPVVKVVNVNPVYNDGDGGSFREDVAVGHPNQVGNGVATPFLHNILTLVLRSRLLSVCSSGVAFLWDVHIIIDRSSGALCDLNVFPPLIRLDGLGSLTVSPRKSPEAPLHHKSPVGEFWDRAAPYSGTTPLVSYDPHRDYLIWTLPQGAPVSSVDHRGDYELESFASGSAHARRDIDDWAFAGRWALDNGGFVKVWNLRLVDSLTGKAGCNPPPPPRPPPRMPPSAVLKLPVSAALAEFPTTCAIAGLPHTIISAASLACLCISGDGSRLVVYTSPLPSNGDGVEGEEEGAPFLSSAALPVKKKGSNLSSQTAKPKVMFANFSPLHEVVLAGSNGLSPFAKGSWVSGSYLSPDVLAVATDQCVVIVNLSNGESLSSGLHLLCEKGVGGPRAGEFADTPPTRAPAGPIHAIISVGGVGNRPGVIYVENNKAYACRLSAARLPNVCVHSPVERVDLRDPVMLCSIHERSSPRVTIRSTRVSDFVNSPRPGRCPPKLMCSPSGRYLCLYWEDERSYEILHASSLLARDQNMAGCANPTNSRASLVDRGTATAFSWIGDDDKFAILRQPEHVALKVLNIPNSVPLRKNQVKPEVELFKLAEVEADAVELTAGATVAAATTVSLGNLNIRGGERLVPNALFGGPSLCIGCLSVSDSKDNIAYFYSRTSISVENNDEQASAYATIGTSIPYPDLVAWDEDGRLCAVAYGPRVAIYLSGETKFILLGSVQIGAPENNFTKPTLGCRALVSLRFVQGVLYCSTQFSVHAIFLGNTEENDYVCELDTFTIATEVVPLYGTDSPELSSPTPVITVLMQPHILGYHSGGLLISTLCGLRLLPLSHPIIRIGTLLAAHLTERARKCLVMMPKSEHDNLAHFLIRRGHIDLVFSDLDGLSVETFIDTCIRYERTGDLERLIYTHGPQIVPEICEWGRDADGIYSGYFAIGVFMLAKGRVECVRKLIAESSSELGNGRKSELLADAMKLTTLVSALGQPGDSTMFQLMGALNLNGKDLANFL